MSFEKIKNYLKNKVVGVAGAGGLGSNCAVALARAGVGKIIISDFDIIEESNLNRQYYFYNQIGQSKALAIKENISNIDPHIIVEAHDIKLDHTNIKGIYQNCDVIVEAFDKAEMKQMIIETVLLKLNNIPLIIGSGMAGWGKSNIIKTLELDNLYICGDGISEVSDDMPPLAPRVGIVANMQANQVLEILLKNINADNIK